MFALVAGTARSRPPTRGPSSFLGRVLPTTIQVRTAKGGAKQPNRQVLATRTKKQRAFRMKKNNWEPPPPMVSDGVHMFQAMPIGKLTEPILKDPRPVLDLPAFLPERLTPSLSGSKALAFSAKENDPMRIYGLPRNIYLDFRLLSRPCSVVRDATFNLVGKLEPLLHRTKSSSWSSRTILTGSPGCGKSYLMLQSLEYCKSAGFITLYIPRASKLVDSSTPYSYDLRTRTYAQPTFSFQLLDRFLKVNAQAIEQLSTTKDFFAGLNDTLPAGAALVNLIQIGLRDHALAPAVLTALFEELGTQTTFPVLLAIDDIQSLYCRTSRYRNPLFQGVKPYHLSTPRLLLEYVSGKKNFARGAVLGAVSASNTDFPMTIELQEALGLPTPRPVNQYTKRSGELQGYMHKLQNFAVPERLSVDEAASLLEVWNKDRAVHNAADDEFLLSKYTEASGNARDFVWNGILRTMST